MILVQLMIASSMRHAHTGLSIPDFPTAYGKWWPALDTASVVEINKLRAINGQVPTSSAQIVLQMAHRIFSIAILAGVATFAWLSHFIYPFGRLGKIWVFLVGIQMGLGAWTIWSDKAADIATAHMGIGALIFLLGVQLTFRLFYGTPASRDHTG